MMKTFVWMMVFGLVLGLAPAQAENGHRIGGGVNYWVALDNLDSEFDDNGLSYLASYQYRGGLLGLQIDAEYMDKLFAADAYAPVAYLILGSGIYVAAGAGILNYDGDWADDPFYAFKAGLDLELLPNVYLDIGASYRFASTIDVGDAIDDIDTDTVFLGAAVRLGL